MKFIVLAFLITVCLSGRVCLKKGWVLEWSYSDGVNIDFVLTLTEDTWNSYGWVGIGFQYVDEENEGMENADINNFILGSNPTDNFADESGLPPPDTDFGATDNILNPVLDQANYRYTWSRPIDSQDGKYDKIYTKDSELIILWACGQMSSGTQIKHLTSNRDKFTITLSEDANIDCTDSFLQINY